MTHWTSCENQWIHDLQDVIVDFRCFPCIFLMILVIYYYMAVNLYTFSVAVLSSLPSIFSALLEDSMNLYTFFFVAVFSSLRSIFSALLEDSMNLYPFFFVAVFFPLPSIFSALLEDSKKVSFQRGFARYLRLSRVPVQGVKILVVLGR